MKKWEIISEEKSTKQNVSSDELVKILLSNRGFKDNKSIENFLHPKLEDVTPDAVAIDPKQLRKALKRIKKAIDVKEQIVVFGDYDVDGITGSAILWETLHGMGATVIPFIPNRIDEGYGLSTKALENEELKKINPSLIITVDNGIVANEAVDFANRQGIDVIITDHHTASDKLPDAYAIVHTTKLCGAGVAYLLSQELNNIVIPSKDGIQSKKNALITGSRVKPGMTQEQEDFHLELATLGTVADLVPLVGANRAIVKHGLAKLSQTKRFGLRELYKQAGIDNEVFSVYEIGYVIGPRLNAAGRIESAMDSLRLLCTTNLARAQLLAEQLEGTNKERQYVMRKAANHAISKMRDEKGEMRNILIVGHEEYPQGVIGLVAGKLVEEFYRPAIVLSMGEKESKASARSVSGFNIIEFLRSASEYLINVGGHPMAAGFTVETSKLPALKEFLEKEAEKLLTDDTLTRRLKIDCALPLSSVNQELYDNLQQLAPFGMGNPEPVFVSREVTVENIKVIGREGTHLKLILSQAKSPSFDAIAFGMAEVAKEIKRGDKIDIAYTLDENTWNGTTKLQLKVKDILLSLVTFR
jgi:single-stranded-DNA-specific exonuclease